MKLSVFGAGAVGSVFGGLVKYHNPAAEVVMIGRGPHGVRMRQTGQLSVEGPSRICTVSVRSSDDPAEIAESDLVLLTVKSQVTEEAIRAALPFLGSAVVATLQNGINQRVLADYVAPDRLVMGITAANMRIAEPGVATLQRNGVTVIGSCTQTSECLAVRTAARILQGSGLEVVSSDRILGIQYNKLLINSLGYASVLSASDFILEGILDRAWRQAVAIPLLEEGMGVLEQAGIHLETMPGPSDAHRFGRLLQLLQWPLLGTTARIANHLFGSRKRIVYSVYQDLVRGRRTEIDFINGEIVRLARERGGDAPRNATVVEMVRALEARRDGAFYTRDEVIAAFRRVAQLDGAAAGQSDLPRPTVGGRTADGA